MFRGLSLPLGPRGGRLRREGAQPAPTGPRPPAGTDREGRNDPRAERECRVRPHRDRAGGAPARSEPYQAVPAPVQRSLEGRPKLPLPRRHGRGRGASHPPRPPARAAARACSSSDRTRAPGRPGGSRSSSATSSNCAVAFDFPSKPASTTISRSAARPASGRSAATNTGRASTGRRRSCAARWRSSARSSRPRCAGPPNERSSSARRCCGTPSPGSGRSPSVNRSSVRGRVARTCSRSPTRTTRPRCAWPSGYCA